MSEHKTDLIHGFAAIGSYLGITQKAAQRRSAKGELPTFRIGSGTTIYARRSELDKCREERVPRRKGRPPLDPLVREERKQTRIEVRAKVRTAATELKTAHLDQQISGGLLYGMPAIADFLELSVRQVGHLHNVGGLPTFKMGGKVCARRSTLMLHLAELEAAGIK